MKKNKTIIIILAIGAILGKTTLFGQFTVNGTIKNSEGNVFGSTCKVTLFCQGMRVPKNATITGGQFSIFVNNVKPSCGCSINISSSTEGSRYFASEDIFVSEGTTIVEKQIKLTKTFNKEQYLKDLLASKQTMVRKELRVVRQRFYQDYRGF